MTAPNESEVDGAVVTEVAFAGATVLDVAGAWTDESVLTVCGVVLWTVLVEALAAAGAVVDAAPLGCTVASGADFLISL